MVLILVALVAVLTIPGLTSIARAGNVNAAITEIAGLLTQARQYAVAGNTYVWVGFYTNNDPTTGDPSVYAAVWASTNAQSDISTAARVSKVS